MTYQSNLFPYIYLLIHNTIFKDKLKELYILQNTSEAT